MHKFKLESPDDWEKWKNYNRVTRSRALARDYHIYHGVHEDDLKTPSRFPCILLISEIDGNGWHENDFVSEGDFR
jgi:hypothetical protein